MPQMQGAPGSSRQLALAKPLDVSVVDADGNQITSFGSSGGLTDAELRATPVPVSGTVTTSSATPLAVRYEEASSTITYIGDATAGSATSAASWRIKRMDTTAGIAVTWADGDTDFNNVWDNRASLSYS